MDHAGDISDENAVLFSLGHFHLLGFDVDDEDGDGDYRALTRLLRRGLGLVHWEFHAGVTHVVVRREADPSVRETLRSMQLAKGNSNGPLTVVSSTWVLDSWTSQELQDVSQYPPTYRSVADTAAHKPSKAAPAVPEGSTPAAATAAASSIFRGSLFCLIRMAGANDDDDDDGAAALVDFDAAVLEREIRRHGGQLLSPPLLEALRADASSARNGSTKQRRLYAVCWGAYDARRLDRHPLLAAVRRLELCRVEPVTPVWLRTCATEGRLLSPRRHLPALFVPSPQAWRVLGPAVRVAVSGFAGPERVALIHSLEALAAPYDDALVRGQTTRLIVARGGAGGAKYDMAVAWGIPVVGADWLSHVAQHGLAGDPPDPTGTCELRFPPPEAEAEA